MKKYSFREWLDKNGKLTQEASTDTGDIAGFSRPIIPGFIHEKKKDKKKKKKK